MESWEDQLATNKAINSFWKKMDIKRHDCVDFTYKLYEPDDLLSRVYYALDNQSEMAVKRKIACKDHLFKNDGLASLRFPYCRPPRVLSPPGFLSSPDKT